MKGREEKRGQLEQSAIMHMKGNLTVPTPGRKENSATMSFTDLDRNLMLSGKLHSKKRQPFNLKELKLKIY